ncbi:Hypothetical predicted protein [Cloeon dipterum]|nr:Hypothetical predicted protein [Cloeon dipterum]
MVYIHGESFEWNSGNPYDGSVLASYGGVVFVTINYRLGILGFLNANTDRFMRTPANYGLMDQIAALHWVKENIAAFGGDPTNVTIVGQSTGAACINLLMTSSAIPDGMLFHRAILMSGSSLSPWALVADPSKFARHVASSVNCSVDVPDTHLLKCLRERPLEALMRVPSPQLYPADGSLDMVSGGHFSATAFGPSVDGVVIDAPPPMANVWNSGQQRGGSGINSNFVILDTIGGSAGGGSSGSVNPEEMMQKKYIDRLGRYDLLFGVVRAEAYFVFAAEDIQYGIENERRGKLLKAFVRDTYRYHQNEILATVVNEYTDWERPVQHPINIRDETMEALGDAQVVAPLVRTGDFHSVSRPSNSFFYVFDYQTKFGDFPQRQGCVHGEELPYIFGAPLVGGLSHFPRNYTKAEVQLSEAVMIYWSNFARTGNPNEPLEPDAAILHAGRSERNRFRNIEWPPYEAVHKKYLSIDTKPKLKNHYRAHRLSFWLNLVPDLHRPGGPDIPPSHHLLNSQDEAETSQRSYFPSLPKSIWPGISSLMPGGTAVPSQGGAGAGGFNLTAAVMTRVTSSPKIEENVQSLHTPESGEQHEDGFAVYSTALSVTVAIGCSLLILNVLIFAGVYYQRDKQKIEVKRRNENGGQLAELELAAAAAASMGKHQPPPDPGGGGQTQLPPPEFADVLPAAHYYPHHHHHHTLPRPPPPPKSVAPPPELIGGPMPPPAVVVTASGTLQRSRTHVESASSGASSPVGNAPGKTATLKKANLHGKVSQLANSIDELRV